jgi:hypothetical protein
MVQGSNMDYSANWYTRVQGAKGLRWIPSIADIAVISEKELSREIRESILIRVHSR